MKIVYGDLLQLASSGHFDAIIHSCTLNGEMETEMAKRISRRYPEVIKADKEIRDTSIYRLGFFSVAYPTNLSNHPFAIINAYIKDAHKPEVRVENTVLTETLKNVKAIFANRRIAYPFPEKELFEGEWDEIAEIIDHEFTGLDHTLVIPEQRFTR